MIGRPFRPGQSGNPSGRPKVEGVIRDLARSHTREAFERLLRIMRESTDDRSVVLASNAVLDRGWGKPAQTLELDARHQWGGEDQVTITSANPAPVIDAQVVQPKLMCQV